MHEFNGLCKVFIDLRTDIRRAASAVRALETIGLFALEFGVVLAWNKRLLIVEVFIGARPTVK